MRELGQRPCFPRAPEICVEVISPSNTDAELREKGSLYFAAGALDTCCPGFSRSAQDSKVQYLNSDRLKAGQHTGTPPAAGGLDAGWSGFSPPAARNDTV